MTTTGLAPFCSNEAEATLVSAMTPATDRSIPPVMITSVMPMDTMSRLPLLMNRLKNTCGFCMAG